MRMPILLLSLLLIVAWPAVAGVEMKFDADADYASFRTYAWKDGNPARRADAERTIADAVDHELAGKALTLVETDPDLYVATYVLVDRHTLKELSQPTQWEYWTGIRSVDAYRVGAGTLVIDLVDARSGSLVWRALASETVSGSADRMRKKLPKIVRNILMQYPPATPGGS